MVTAVSLTRTSVPAMVTIKSVCSGDEEFLIRWQGECLADSSSAGQKDGGFERRGQAERCTPAGSKPEDEAKPRLKMKNRRSRRFGKSGHGCPVSEVVAAQCDREGVGNVCRFWQACQTQLNFDG